MYDSVQGKSADLQKPEADGLEVNEGTAINEHKVYLKMIISTQKSLSLGLDPLVFLKQY